MYRVEGLLDATAREARTRSMKRLRRYDAFGLASVQRAGKLLEWF